MDKMEVPQPKESSWQRSPKIGDAQEPPLEPSLMLGGARGKKKNLERARSGRGFREDYFGCKGEGQNQSKDDLSVILKKETSPREVPKQSLLSLRDLSADSSSVSSQRQEVKTKKEREEITRKLESDPTLLKGLSSPSTPKKEPSRSPSKKVLKAIRGKTSPRKVSPAPVISEVKAREQLVNEFSSSQFASSPPSEELISSPSPSSSSLNISQQTKDTVEALKIANAPDNFQKGSIEGEGEALPLAEQVIIELVKTEKSYVLDLVLLMTSYKMPTSSNSLLPPSVSEKVFVNVHQLLLLHTKLLKKFGSSPTLRSVMESFGGVWGELIKEYGEYANGYSKSVLLLLDAKNLTKEFVQFCKRSRNNPANKGLSLEDFLIKPIQRICKYPLLFRELSKHLGEAHPLFEQCSECQERVGEVAACVNAARHAFEATKEIQHILDELRVLEGESDGRVYLAKGETKKENADCYLYLFSDVILLCTLKDQVLQLDKLIDLSSETLNIQVTEEGKTDRNAITISDLGANFCFVLDLPSIKEVMNWNNLFLQLKEKYHWNGAYEQPASVKPDYDF